MFCGDPFSGNPTLNRSEGGARFGKVRVNDVGTPGAKFAREFEKEKRITPAASAAIFDHFHGRGDAFAKKRVMGNEQTDLEIVATALFVGEIDVKFAAAKAR